MRRSHQRTDSSLVYFPWLSWSHYSQPLTMEHVHKYWYLDSPIKSYGNNKTVMNHHVLDNSKRAEILHICQELWYAVHTQGKSRSIARTLVYEAETWITYDMRQCTFLAHSATVNSCKCWFHCATMLQKSISYNFSDRNLDNCNNNWWKWSIITFLFEFHMISQEVLTASCKICRNIPKISCNVVQHCTRVLQYRMKWNGVSGKPIKFFSMLL